jgi:hypothetical protein
MIVPGVESDSIVSDSCNGMKKWRVIMLEMEILKAATS